MDIGVASEQKHETCFFGFSKASVSGDFFLLLLPGTTFAAGAAESSNKGTRHTRTPSAGKMPRPVKTGPSLAGDRGKVVLENKKG